MTLMDKCKHALFRVLWANQTQGIQLCVDLEAFPNPIRQTAEDAGAEYMICTINDSTEIMTFDEDGIHWEAKLGGRAFHIDARWDQVLLLAGPEGATFRWMKKGVEPPDPTVNRSDLN